MSKALTQVRAGFIPLVDAASMIVAKELGYAEAEGIDLVLAKETSWATIRDRLAVAHLDVAHILAPMPVAANLGLGPLSTPMVVPMALGTGANSVTVSNGLWTALSEFIAAADFDAGNTLEALAKVVEQRRQRKDPPLKLGIVHQFSAHHYQLAYWLAKAGINTIDDVSLVILPPPLLPDALASGSIDGFCAGEPWGTVAAFAGTGVILTTNAHIWRNSPEKVLGVRKEWMETHPDVLPGLIRAIYRAAQWCDATEHQDELARILARSEYVGQQAQLLRPCLSRRLKAPNGQYVHVDGFLNFASKAATFPWRSHALWFYSQIVRWGQAQYSEEGAAIARDTYRPDIYRAAVEPMGVEVPSANSKVEGALSGETLTGATQGKLSLGPDKFFDGSVFDPERLEDYLASFKTTS